MFYKMYINFKFNGKKFEWITDFALYNKYCKNFIQLQKLFKIVENIIIYIIIFYYLFKKTI